MNPALRALNGFGLGARPGERRRVERSPRLVARATPGRTADCCGAGRGHAGRDRRGDSRVPRRRARRRSTTARSPSAGAPPPRRDCRRRKPRRAHRARHQRRVRSSNGWSRSGRITCACRSARRCSWRRSPAATSARRFGRTCSGVSTTWCSRRRSIRRMLVYLDNLQSIGPNSRGARGGGRGGRARLAQARGPQRELRARAAGAAHARRQRRLHAAGRAGAREDADGLDRWRSRRGRAAGRRRRAGAGNPSARQS